MDEHYHIELDDEIDLHHFHPKDVKLVLKDFIEDARERGIGTIRIIHGKGQSVLKSIVRGVLEKNDDIVEFHDDMYNWGATIAVVGKSEKNG
ncbi:MAG TPA: Smr/MutS family protein [Spirochaetota bacterium]|nr:Smr/MutS family protein [Spirochaetota bacterium]